MSKKTQPPSRTKIHVLQKRKEQIQTANAVCTQLAANLGMVDFQIARLEANKAKLRQQLQIAFTRRKDAIDSAAFDHDLDLKEWSYDVESAAFVKGKTKPNLTAIPAEPPIEVVDKTTEEAPTVDESADPVVIPRGGGSLDD